LFPVNVSVEGVSERFSGEVDPIELIVVTRLFSRVGRDDSDLRSVLAGNLRQSLRDYLERGVPIMMQQEDFSGEQKSNLASALAQVGEPDDMVVLRQLIAADIERIRKGREARAQGNRGRIGSGANMSYANWYVRAVATLDADTADTVLLDVLKEPEYERWAAEALIKLASTPRIEAGFGKKREYKQVWEARAGQMPDGFNEVRRKRYADAIRERVTNILDEGTRTGQTDDYRLKELTKALAALDGLGSTELIFRALSITGRFNGWPIVGALETLLFNGVTLPTEETLKLFDTIREQVGPHLYNDQHAGLLAHALSLLPFVEDASVGIQKVRQVIADLKIRSHELREVATALGNSRCNEALGVLRELASDKINAGLLGDAWIDAVATLDSPEARQILLGLVDPQIPAPPFDIAFDREHVVATRLVELARRDGAVEQRLIQLCAVQLTAAKRSLLARVISWLGTPEAGLAALKLIDDNAIPTVPYETWKQIENAFVEHKPYGKDTNSYQLAPRSSNDVRTRLFEMATNDKQRMKSAAALLGQIEVWRLEHGRPDGEPRSVEVERESSWPAVPSGRLRPDAARAG
jgi:hypothetical protein